MATLGPIRLGAFALIATLLLTAEPVQSQDKCRTGCMGVKPSLFKYAEGTTYKYNLDGSVDIELTTAEGQASSTKIKATVLLNQQGDCNQVLRLENVQVIGADGKKHSKIPNIEKPIKLNFHDGHIEDLVCAEKDDTQVSLNIKRAVASLFQANIKKKYETDVFGACPTDVNTRKEGAIFVIQKSKELNKCAHRESVKQDFMATSFNLHSEIKSSPILNADYLSEQKLKSGILDQATITENYFYVPFSAGKNGARAKVTTKIQLVGTSKDAIQSAAASPRTILFESPHNVLSDKTNVNVILNAVKDTVKTIKATVSDKTANKFLNLVRIMRASKRDDLLSVFNQVNAGTAGDKDVAKKVFLDALFRAGTGDTVEVTIQLLKSKPLSALEQKLVYLGLAFVRHATPEALKAAATILDKQDLPREAYLGIGTLAGRYCKSHSCENEEGLNTLVQKLLAKLGTGKATNRAKENELIAILKAFGNIDHLASSVVPKIVAIAQDKKSSNRLRVAALETLQTDACQDKIRDSSIGILKDIQQDAEIRIKAYLTAVKCPNGKVAQAIKNVLQSEPSYQVGGFIVSHLRNLKASANPDKEFAKQQLGLVSSNKNFPFDIRKYSYNHEFSYSIDSLGLSTATESNVIYSQNSFLPRSTSWNMTTEVFGHTFNFLEIDTRQENFDKILEHYFGPVGVFRKEDPEDFVKSKQSIVEKFFKHIDARSQKLRSRRDVTKQEIDAINKQVQIKTNELNNDLDLDLSVKLFGSELLFLTINEDAKKYTPDVIVDKIFDGLESGVDKLKNFDHTARSNVIFLDAELSYPTSTGFPLKINIEGVSAVQVQTKGAIDLKAISKLQETIFKLSLIPSANIEVNGRLAVDAYFVESGLKTTSNYHVSTGSGLEIGLLQSGKGFDTKISFPLKKHELISATHDIVFHNRELGVQETEVPLKFPGSKPLEICADHLSGTIGLTFCVDYQRPAVNPQAVVLPFPLDGNSKLSVRVENDDLDHFHVKGVAFFEAGTQGAEFQLQAIGNGNKKKASFEAKLDIRPEPYIRLALESPIRNTELVGKITMQPNEKSISLKLADMIGTYYGKVGVTVSGGDGKRVYKPIIDYQIPNVQPGMVKAEGQVIVEDGNAKSKYTFNNVKLTTHNQRSFSINGNFGSEGSSNFFADITVSDGKNSASLNGKAVVSHPEVKINAEFTNNANPSANINLKYELQRAKEISSNLQIIHGADLNSKVNVLKLTNKFTHYYTNKDDFKLATKNHFSYPLLAVDVKFNMLSEPKKFEYEAGITYNHQKYSSELEAQYNMKTNGEYDVKFELEGFKNKVEAKAKRNIHGEASKISKSLQVNNWKGELDGEIKHHYKPKDIDIGADLTIKISSRPQAYKLKNSLVLNANELDSMLKVQVGDNAIVDIFLKSLKGGDANGNVKVNLKDLLNVNGQLKANKGKGTANLVLDFVKVPNKVKLDSSFNIAAPTFDIDVTLYPQFEKDNNKKVVLSTHNKVSENAIESKNKLDVLGKTLQGDLKATKEGDIKNGKHHIEFEVTLPDNQFFSGKMDRQMQTSAEDFMTGNGVITIERRENKNAPGCKVVLKGNMKNTNAKQRVYDITYDLTFDDSKGKTLHAVTTLQRQKTADGSNSKLTLKSDGSVLKDPSELVLESVHRNKHATYKINGKCGPKTSISYEGDHQNGVEGKPCENNIKLEIHTPSTKFSVLKFDTKSSLLLKKDSADGYTVAKGSTSLFIDDDGSAPEATVDIKTDYDIKAKPHDGHLKGSLSFQKLDPISVALGYKHEEGKDTITCHSDLTVDYAKGKTVKLDTTLKQLNKNEFDLDLLLETPHEQARSVKINAHGKKSEDNKQFNGKTKLKVNDKEYQLTSELVQSKITPSIDLQLKHPEGHSDKFIAKITKSSPKELGAELQLDFPKYNFELSSKLDGRFESPDDFHVKVTANSKALNLDHIVAEASSKGAKGDKKIQFTAVAAGKNLVSGSTTYKTSEEGGKFLLEGSGNVKVKDQSQSMNFKFTRQNLEADKHGEQGIELSFDASIGNKAIDAEFKATNKQLRILDSYCEEKKQCAHFEVDSKITEVSKDQFNHLLEINVDLRKLGLSHEFGLKAETTVKQYVIDHTVDVHFQNQENSKYQYSVYVHPAEAGASLTTPKRIISLEGKIDKVDKTSLKTHIFLYLDKKNQPNKKAALTYEFQTDDDKNLATAKVKSVTKFTAPGLPKEMTISLDSNVDWTKNFGNSEIVLDIFANPNQKLVISSKSSYSKDEQSGYGYAATITAKSPGLGVDYSETEELLLKPSEKTFKYNRVLEFASGGKKYTTGVHVDTNPSEANVWAKILSTELFKMNSKYQLSKETQVFDTVTSIYGFPTYVSRTEFLNHNTYHYTAYRQDKPNDKLVVHAAFIVGQIADYRAEIQRGGKKFDLVHSSVKLDDANFLKSDYGIKLENLKNQVFEPARENIKKGVAQQKQLGESLSGEAVQISKNVGEKLKNSLPKFMNTRNYYSSEFEKIKQEIASDKTIVKVTQFLTNVFGAALETIRGISARFLEFAEKTLQVLQANFNKIAESIQKELIPLLKKRFELLIGFGAEVFDKVSEGVFLFLGKISEFLEQHQGEIKRISTAISQVGQDLGKAIMKMTENLRQSLTTLLQNLTNEIKSLPIYEELKNKYKEYTENFQVNDAVINTLKEIAVTFKSVIPMPEWERLVNDIANYAEKVLKKEAVNHDKSIEGIVADFVAFVKKLLESVNFKDGHLQTKVQPTSFDYFFKLPKNVAVKLSPISYLLNGEFPSIKEFLHTVTFNPLLWIPPFQIQGVIAQGQHIFTFDGKHLTFPGKCNYLLVKDAVNGNFTVIGTYTNGLLSAITVSDKENVATVKKDGKLMFNNAASEYPARKGYLHAFKIYHTVHIRSRAGLHIVCTNELEECAVLVSGFYHGQLRGLLGNGNNEAYDDFTLPNGKIVTSESDFGNAYKAGANCPVIKTVDHSHHTHTPSCSKYFGDESSLRLCFPFVNPENFRMACDHGVAANVKDAELAAAGAYVTACTLRGIPAALPEDLTKCKNDDDVKSLGDTFSVKTPGKAADVIIAIDQTKPNDVVYKELVQPLTQQLTAEFKTKGISDVEYHVIGYGGEYKHWPSHFTVGGKLTSKDKLPQVTFHEKEPEEDFGFLDKKYADALKKLTSVAEDAKIALGLDPQSLAYREAARYPFRAHASKIVIAVTGEPCKHGRFLLLQYIRALLSLDKSIHLNLITPFENLSKEDKPAKSIIGFNGNGAFSTEKGKKDASAELLKELNYKDYCVDFTIKSGGNAFVTNNFISAKGPARKQYLQTVTHTIVEQVTDKQLGLDCECRRDSPRTARNICKVVDVKDKHAKVSGRR